MKIRPVAGLCFLGALLLVAQSQDWKTATTLPAVDMDGLTAAQKTKVLQILRDESCTCGCGMTIAQCRVQDPGCSFSKGLASSIVASVKQGKSEQEAMQAAVAKFSPKLLEDPVAIPTAGSPSIGPADARITLVEFSDFQCPYCAHAVRQLDAVLNTYPGKVRLIFKQFPLSTHPQASISAAASLAAQQQGKFWEMYYALFGNRERLSRKTILSLAEGMGMDMKRFTADLDSPEIRKAVARDAADGDKAGVDATPTVFINGQRYNGSLALDAFKPVLEAELKKAPKR
jgi:protein-disulfide isomerase